MEFIYVKMKIYIFDAYRYFIPLKTYLFIIFYYWLCFTTVESSLYFVHCSFGWVYREANRAVLL